MRFWLELDTLAMIGGINARAADDNDNPRKWQVHVADSDGGHGDKIVAEGSGPIIATWPAVRGQWVLIDCLDEDPFWWWSLHELTIDAVDIPPVIEPPPVEPPIVDEEVGPAVFNEVLARYWVKRWAEKFDWKVSEPCFVTGPGELLVTQSVIYPILRNKGDGVFEPWPFTIPEGG